MPTRQRARARTRAYLDMARAMVMTIQDRDANAYFLRAGPLGGNIRTAITELCVGLKRALSINNLTDRFDAIYVLANETSTAALLNVVKNSHAGTLVQTPTFTAMKGYTGTSNGAINCNATMNALSRFAQDSGHFSVYNRTSRTSAGGATRCLMGCRGAATGHNRVLPYVAADSTARTSLNCDATDSMTSVSNARGYHIISRTASTAFTWYQNGAAFASPSETSAALQAVSMHILADNGNGTPANFANGDEVALATIGAGLSAAEAVKMHTVVERFMDRIGAGVV